MNNVLGAAVIINGKVFAVTVNKVNVAVSAGFNRFPYGCLRRIFNVIYSRFRNRDQLCFCDVGVILTVGKSIIKAVIFFCF